MITAKPQRWRSSVAFTVAVLLVGFIGLQFLQPELPNPPVTQDFAAPVAVKSIVRRACYDCHSNQTALRWFDRISPVSWQVAAHIKEGRKGLNFSNWGDLKPPEQQAKLWEAVNQIVAGAMPLRDYTLVHPAAKVSAADLAVLKQYLLDMASHAPVDTTKARTASTQYQHWRPAEAAHRPLPKALNGIEYIPEYKNWQPISTTERFDNGTLRVVFGNPVAVKAIQENHHNPWPNGTIFAKVAWDQVTDKTGQTHTGAFKQVEYMIKDDQQYAATKGWGWARFKTPEMIPYGKNALFTTECINCHRPVSDRDFVFTLPVKH